MIAERTRWPDLGLVPHLDALSALPAEDSMELADRTRSGRPDAPLRVAVPVLPSIANFDDLDPLRVEPGVTLRLVTRGSPLPRDCELVILPGSKATIADLAALRI